jgi:hypothetical protein
VIAAMIAQAVKLNKNIESDKNSFAMKRAAAA